MGYIISRAKKNLHECEFHLKAMRDSRHVEELEICYAAFVNSARNVTFVLQKEFKKNKKFVLWYKKKQLEMKHDPLCKYFLDQRNSIIKEGVSGVRSFSTDIESLNTETDMINKPSGAQNLMIRSDGLYWDVYPETPQADVVPAYHKGRTYNTVELVGVPEVHLGKTLRKDVFSATQVYYLYLKSLVEECTKTVNS